MTLLRAGALFVATALAEILGCYLPYLWLRKGKTFLLVFPAALSLAADATPNRCGSDLCRLRWGLCNGHSAVVVARGEQGT
jgi:hypothetical protein